ncbi:MAG TPA: hypothetical protein VMU16_11410 [Candidatus Binataceae bacterium]|nr:hypothetical protein [Candidatus Binataceae bacterium]
MADPKIPTYSSLAAFLAHYHALKCSTRKPDDEQLFTSISAIIDALDPVDREALDSDVDDGAARRHRDRAELKLLRLLAARGIVTG